MLKKQKEIDLLKFKEIMIFMLNYQIQKKKKLKFIKKNLKNLEEILKKQMEEILKKLKNQKIKMI